MPDAATGVGELDGVMRDLGARARRAAAALAEAAPAAKTAALRDAARLIRARASALLAANARDIGAAQDAGATPAFVDRVRLDHSRIEAIAAGLEAVAALADPVGRELARWTPPNGLDIARVAVPLGVVGIVYEARPNVTADAGGLCIKAGNAAILRGGSESFESSQVLVAALRDALAAAGLPADAVACVPTRDRAAVGILLATPGLCDVVVPRGGKSLIERVMREARVPVIAHLEGLCATYVHAAADPAQARAIVLNAKMRRVSVCGATETLLVDRSAAPQLLAPILDDLAGAGCAVRGDEGVRALWPRAKPASEQDWSTEDLDAIIAVKLVDGLDAAIAHINRYGSHHTDAIVTRDAGAAEAF